VAYLGYAQLYRRCYCLIWTFSATGLIKINCKLGEVTSIVPIDGKVTKSWLEKAAARQIS